MRRSYKYRLYPSKGQEERMLRHLGLCKDLYNAMIEQRRRAWNWRRESVSRYDQEKQLKDLRAAMPEYKDVYSHVLQDVARRVDLAFQAFYRRCKEGQTPGYPRFKSKYRYHSLTYKEPGNGCVNVDERGEDQAALVSFSKLAKNVRCFMHRPIQGTIRTVTVQHKRGDWYVIFSCDDVEPENPPEKGEGTLGVDVGLTTFATLSTGETIPNPRWLQRAREKIQAKQRDLSRCTKYSYRWKQRKRELANLHEKVARQRRDHHFKLARSLVERFDTIAVEDLDTKDMVQDSRLAESIHDAAWVQFTSILEHKAEEAGAKVVRVKPRGTSQACSRCGNVVPKTLRDRTHSCSECGLVLDRDHNAAINIQQRARAGPARTATAEVAG